MIYLHLILLNYHVLQQVITACNCVEAMTLFLQLKCECWRIKFSFMYNFLQFLAAILPWNCATNSI
jgi:hypothetical protein